MVGRGPAVEREKAGRVFSGHIFSGTAEDNVLPETLEKQLSIRIDHSVLDGLEGSGNSTYSQ